jgi:hypothetical protein
MLCDANFLEAMGATRVPASATTASAGAGHGERRNA